MKVIEKEKYYKMSELVEISGLNNHTILFYNKKGLLPNTMSTSKNMNYYPQITITVLNIIKYFKDNLNFSIDYIKELFDYYQINFDNKSDLILQSIQMLSMQIKNPKTETEVLKIFNELKKYDISIKLISEYVKMGKKLAFLEKELTNKVLEKTGVLPEILVLDILNSFKPYIFNRHTINEFQKEN